MLLAINCQVCAYIQLEYLSDFCTPAAAEVTISNLTLASRTDSFTVSHPTQDGSINITQPADSDTSHTLTSLQAGTTYRTEVEAVRKGDRADRQKAKVVGNYNTDGAGEESMQQPLMPLDFLALCP